MNLEGNLTSKQALKGVLAIRQGIDGKDGKDGQNGKDGYTPQKGIDYFDGEKGEQGEVSIAYADSHYSPSIITSASGEVITTTDSAKAKPKNIKLFGKGKQRQYEGNQLFDISNYTMVNGVLAFDMSNLTSGKTYTFSSKNALRFKISTDTTGETISDSGDYVKTYTFTPIYSDTQYIFFRTENGWVSDISVLQDSEIKFEIGSVATPYEPYVGNEPSPSMNYPQKAEFLGESGSIGGKVLNKNLWNKEHASDTNNWNIVDAVSEYYLGLPVYVGKGNTVTLNCYQIIPNGMTDIFTCITLEKKYSDAYQYWFYHANNNALQNKPVTVTATEDYIYIWCLKSGLHNGKFMTYIGNDLQIEYGSKKTDFIPYTEQPFTFQTPNGLRGIPLGQTIPDAIKNSPIHMNGVYRDERDGLYYIGDTKNENGKDVQRCCEAIVTRAYSIESINDTTVKVQAILGDGLIPSLKVQSALCDKLVLGYHNEDMEHFYMFDSGVFALFINRSRLESEDLDGVNAFLSSNPLEVTYVLAEPIITDTTEEEKAQLDNLVMNYPNTTVVNDAGAYMEVEYVADTKMYVDESKKELEERIDEIVIEGGGDVDLSGYATKKYVDDLVGSVESILTELHAHAETLIGGEA